MDSYATPTFLRLLLDARVKTILISGVGGGFDFVHSAHLIPLFLQAGKKVIIHSYSFGDPEMILNSVPFTPKDVPEKHRKATKPIPEGFKGWPPVRIVDGCNVPNIRYGPEVGLMRWMDKRFGDAFGEKCSVPRPLPRSAESLKMEKEHAERKVEWLKEQEEKKKKQQETGGGGEKNNSSSATSAAASGGGNAEYDFDDDKGDKIAETPRFFLFASYARDWTAVSLSNFYEMIVKMYDVDAVWCCDGGNDSLMSALETDSELGDPIEDAVTLAAVAYIDPSVLPIRVSTCLGLGCDRFMGVSDIATERAISELMRYHRPANCEVEKSVCGRDQSSARQRMKFGLPSSSGAINDGQPVVCGFLGVYAMERFQEPAQSYRDVIHFISACSSFNSVIANSIIESAVGAHGSDVVPPSLTGRVPRGSLFLGPWMSFLFCFDVRLMFERSALMPLLLKCGNVRDMYEALEKLRYEVKARKAENIK